MMAKRHLIKVKKVNSQKRVSIMKVGMHLNINSLPYDHRFLLYPMGNADHALQTETRLNVHDSTT